MEDDENKAIKITITFKDGHTEEYPVFVAAVAHGLMVVGKHEGEIFYAASKEGFSSKGIIHIAASMEVIVGLLKAISEVQNSVIESIKDRPLQFLKALSLISTKETGRYEETRIIDKKPGEN